jgi:predicted MPP superfamily phosphohydrolase
MKTIAVGDIHGRDVWKEIITKEKPDRVIFIGDYFDSKEDIDGRIQISNFLEIIGLKRFSGKEVILLTGNHDFHYLKGITDEYSGFQKQWRWSIQDVLEENIDYLQMCYGMNNLLFVHAGITKTFLRNNNIEENEDLIDNVNKLFKSSRNSFRFTIGDDRDWYGDDICQTPIWVRPASLQKDKIDRLIQVVGHTQVDQINITSTDLIFIDALGWSKEYIVIDEGEIKIGSLNKE